MERTYAVNRGDAEIARKAERAAADPVAAGGAAFFAAVLAALAVGECLHAAAARRMAKAAMDGYEEVRRRLDSSAMARHDFQKHMTVLQKMLSDGQTERAVAYLDALSDSVGRQTELVYTGNYMIDLLLNGRLGAARDSGVRIDVSAVSVPRTLAVADDALSALLCNAIDNATAAARAGGGGWIRIDMRGRGQMLYIGIANSCSRAAARRAKQGQKGYGKRIMRGIVERYHGVMKEEHHDESYRLMLLLPVDAGENDRWKR